MVECRVVKAFENLKERPSYINMKKIDEFKMETCCRTKLSKSICREETEPIHNNLEQQNHIPVSGSGTVDFFIKTTRRQLPSIELDPQNQFVMKKQNLTLL